MNRSPNYPRLSLPEALEKAQDVWASVQRSVMTTDEAAKCIGYSSLSGPARVKLSALKKYGLLAKEGKGWKLTDRAVHILHRPNSDPQHIEALIAAFNEVELFRSLDRDFPNATKGSIRSHLITDYEFTENGADRALEAYIQSKSVVSIAETTDDLRSEVVDDFILSDTPSEVDSVTKRNARPEKRIGEDVYVLGEHELVICAPPELTQEEYDEIVDYFELYKRKLKRRIIDTDSE